MFVQEDPGKHLTESERQLKVFRVKSFAASRSHSLRRRGEREQQECDAIYQKLRSSVSATSNTPRRRIQKNATLPTLDIPTDAATFDTHYSLAPAKCISQFSYSGDRYNSDEASPVSVSSPFLRLTSTAETLKEGRSVQFFIERTATEWSSWSDAYLFRVLALQASTQHSCVRHALISLAATQEALETPDAESSDKQMFWALQQSRHALVGLSKQHKDLSLGSLLVAHIVLYTASLFLDEVLTFSTMKTMYDLDERLKRQIIGAPTTVPKSDLFLITNYLQPVVERQRAKQGQLVDMLSPLEMTPASHFYFVDRPRVPDAFMSIEEARSTLDQILNWTTYAVKTQNLPPYTVPAEAELEMENWLSALNMLEHSLTPNKSSSNPLLARKREICNVELLRLSAQVYFMLIKNMHCECEMAFDDYFEVYRSIVRVCKLVISCKEGFGRTLFTAGLEANLLTFVGNAACRWCRDPLIRRDLIDVLRGFNGREAFEGAGVWADVADRVRGVEEGINTHAPLSPPLINAAEIPETARVRIDKIELFAHAATMVVNYLRYPYRADPEDSGTAYITNPGCGSYQTWDGNMNRPQGNPDFVFGRGYSKWLKHGSSHEYYSVKSPKFYFNISRI